jgi:hypothetical protein
MFMTNRVNRNFIKVITALSVFFPVGCVFAQSPIETRILGEGGWEIFVGDSRSNFKIGSAVAVRLYSVANYAALSERTLVACDGSWISNSFYFNVHSVEGTSREKIAAMRSDETQDTTSSISRLHPSESKKAATRGLISRLKQLCTTAGAEPKNVLIPIATTGVESDTTYETLSLVSGTAVRNGGLLEIWVRTNEISKTQQMGPDGKPIIVDGLTIHHRQLTGKHNMTRYQIDCRNNSLDTLQDIEYAPGGKVNRSFSVDRKNVRLNPVVPNSVGEGVVEWACLLYK